MQDYPIPENEQQRLKILKEYQLMDSESDADLDDLTQMAASICRTSSSAITLLDENRQWFKSKVGLDVCETPRDQAFCNYAIVSEELFIVEDAAKDARFQDNPLASADPAYRKIYDQWKAFREDSFSWFGTAEQAYAEFSFAKP